MNTFHAIILSAALAGLSTMGAYAAAPDRETALAAAAAAYRPGTTGFGPIKVDSINVNDKKKTVDVFFNLNTTYLPLTKADVIALKTECKALMGEDFKKYKINLLAGGKNIESLALFSAKKNVGPKEKDAFVIREGQAPAPKGLDGANIALWQSHGWYFEPKLNRWEWQRARIFQTVEDLYTQSYVMPFLMPMLENAGAYVMSPRERDTNLNEIIVDNDGGSLVKGTFASTGDWKKTGIPGFAYSKAELKNGDHPFADGSAIECRLSGSADKSTATATWKAAFPQDGEYAVYVSYQSLPNSTKAAKYRVTAANGTHDFTINQKMGGGTWIYLGHFPFKASANEQPVVELFNSGKNKSQVVTADAVKIGGGMGNVARKVKEPLDDIDYEYVTSGYPRFTEGARYFLQWAGAPDSVFTPTDYVNDYGDDYRSRADGSTGLPADRQCFPSATASTFP